MQLPGLGFPSLNFSWSGASFPRSSDNGMLLLSKPDILMVAREGVKRSEPALSVQHVQLLAIVDAMLAAEGSLPRCSNLHVMMPHPIEPDVGVAAAAENR